MVTIYPEGIGPAMVTPDVIKMTVDADVAEATFLMHYFNSELSRRFAFGVVYGITRPRMNLEIFRTMPVPRPPLEEQREIVRRIEALFALADAVERRVAAARKQAEALPPAILARAFSGKLIPTEAELARRESRDYEPASVLLERIRRERTAAPRTSARRGRRLRPDRSASSASPLPPTKSPIKP